MTVWATHFPNFAEFESQRMAGSIHVDPPDIDGEVLFRYFCPCGCGHVGLLTVGVDFKPSGPGATWNWNGKTDAATLNPSVNHVGHWHSWLKDGYWEAC